MLELRRECYAFSFQAFLHGLETRDLITESFRTKFVIKVDFIIKLSNAKGGALSRNGTRKFYCNVLMLQKYSMMCIYDQFHGKDCVHSYVNWSNSLILSYIHEDLKRCHFSKGEQLKPDWRNSGNEKCLDVVWYNSDECKTPWTCHVSFICAFNESHISLR